MYAKNTWEKYAGTKEKELEKFSKEYADFISIRKTEREQVNGSLLELDKAGFKPFKVGMKLKAGDKVYFTNKGKNVAAFVIGKKKISEGLRVLGAHIDSPRIDIKQNPLYEKNGIAFLDTHYYGGIKKYQWTARPLALYGTVCKKDGSVFSVNIGDEEDDPIFGINDLLIHLSADQMQKTVANAIEGENLDITVASKPLAGEEKDPVKASVLKILKEKYDIEEEDFLSAEFEVVPAGKARDFGLDRSMIAGYGHNDKCCAYTSLRAITDLNTVPEYTACCILVDKEEIGSVGATGAQSRFFENTVMDLLDSTGENAGLIRFALTSSYMLSSDVSVGYDPLYPSACEEKNSAFLGNGICLNKYTGARGKSGCNDASPEMIAWLRRIMDENGIHFQTSEIGRVDVGGGGTIAYILSNLNMNVIDAGIPVLNMHAPMEVISKVDLYEAYQAYQVFLKANF